MKRKSRIKKIPGNTILDCSLCLLLEGYPFIQNRRYKYKSDIFQTRLLGKKAICISGEEAAQFFYHNDFFKRNGLAPRRVKKTLLGENGVQGLDGVEHKMRKQMFMSFMTPEKMSQLIEYTETQWKINSQKWSDSIVLFDELQVLLFQVACKWTEIPIQGKETRQRAQDMGKMIDGFAAIGPRYWQGRCARLKSEKWVADIIDDIRNNYLKVARNSIAYTIAFYRDKNGKLLDKQVAAVELINIIRPIVAIATYITFAMLAMIKNPDCKKNFQWNHMNYSDIFAQEVRRYYPFTPFVAAELKEDVIWNQYRLKKGTLTLLDIYGMNHDPRLWIMPYEFIPERFLYRKDNDYSFIPQGGGNNRIGHRCAGESVTIEVLKISLNYIVNNLKYQIPRQNFQINLARIPTLPKCRLIMKLR